MLKPHSSDPKAVSRRAALRWLASGVGLSLLAACAPGAPQAAPSSGATAPPPTAPRAQAGQPKVGGTLRFATGTEPTNFDVHQVAAAQFDGLFQVYDTPR